MAATFRLPLLHPPILPADEAAPVEPVSAVKLSLEPPPLPEGPAPSSRADCMPGGFNEARPCRWHSCRHHLMSEKGTCALDFADQGGMTLEEVGEVLGITRERVRQIESIALRKLAKKGVLAQFRKD